MSNGNTVIDHVCRRSGEFDRLIKYVYGNGQKSIRQVLSAQGVILKIVLVLNIAILGSIVGFILK